MIRQRNEDFVAPFRSVLRVEVWEAGARLPDVYEGWCYVCDEAPLCQVESWHEAEAVALAHECPEEPT